MIADTAAAATGMSSTETPPVVEPAPPEGRRVRRAALTWGWGMLSTVVTTLTGLITTPLIVKYLGDERFGIFRTSLDWWGCLMLVEFGLSGAIGVMILQAQARGERSRVIALTKWGTRTLFYVVVLLLPAAGALIWVMPWLTKASPELFTEVRIASVLGVIGVLLYPLGLTRAIIESAQRGYLIHVTLLLQAVVVAWASVLLARGGWGLLGQAIAATAGTMLIVALFAWFALPFLQGWRSTPAAQVNWREHWRLSWPLGLAGVTNRISLLGDTLVAALLFGPELVTVMFLTQRLITLAGGQVNGLNNSSWAALAELHARGEHKAFEARVTELSRLVVMLGIALTGTVAAYNHRFVALWVGPERYAGEWLTVLTVIAGVVFGFLVLFSWLIDAAGATRQRLAASATGAIVKLVVAAVAGHFWGLPGIVLGTIIGYASAELWYTPMLVSRLYGMDARRAAIKALFSAARAVPWAVAIWFFAHRARFGWVGLDFDGREGDSWVGLTMEMCLAGVVALVFAFGVVLSREDRAKWINRLRRTR